MVKIEIHAGDFPKGVASFMAPQLILPSGPGRLMGESIKLNELEDVQIATPDNIGLIGGDDGWPQRTDDVLRFAEGLSASRKREVVFVARFKDGRKFLATTKGKTYEKLLVDWEKTCKIFKQKEEMPASDKKNANLVIGGIVTTMALAAVAIFLLSKGPPTLKGEPTKASESPYNENITLATTSYNLTKADIAWHAVNTYGWDCDEVLSRGEMTGPYYIVTCSSGVQLRFYPRVEQHPRITNLQGTYD